MNVEDADRLANELIAAGAVFALLGHQLTSVDLVQGEDTAALIVRLPFMKSRYRVTVTMEPDKEAQQGD